MNRCIHYIGQYSENIDFRNLRVFPSALTKMNYIISCLIRSGYEIIVFSPAETKNNFLSHFPSYKVSVNNNITIKYIDTFGCPNLIFRLFSRIWTFIQMIYYLFFSVKKNDVVLIYHTWMYRWPLRIVQLFKKLNIYFEVEEIFHAVYKKSEKAIINEISYLQGANGYILVNDLMKEKLSLKEPALVCYGSYTSTNLNIDKDYDKLIHIVYAGVIAGKDDDIYLAINVLKYLPDNYCLDILGYGTQENVLEMANTIEKENCSLRRLAITYHGCLVGREYYSFLAKSHIGLCPRILENYYSDYTFPSKILVYLGNNLVPVCTPIRSLMESKLRDYLIFSSDQTSQSLANAILLVDIKEKPDFKKVLNEFDNNFCSELLLFFK